MTKEYETIRAIRNKMFQPKLEYKVTAFYGFRGRKDKGIEKADAEQRVPDVSLNDILLMIENKEKDEYRIHLCITGELRHIDTYTEHHIGTLVTLDLTKSIKDQTPETLRAIIKLIED